ncbi:MAG TPA: AmmeMemoRadiSam system protein A [Thermoanaerobaculia bacterium]|nr:AmmeMemoRadiSam system protein A [Thermoanaerobaculia bacterium]
MSGGGSLSDQARRDLLWLARESLAAHFRGEPAPRLPSDCAEAFGTPRGLFVTLTMGGQLRGCIGTLAPEGDVTRVAAEFARRAAFEDPRFPPLEAEELPHCGIEISVLGAPETIQGPGDVVVGRDGLIIEGRGRRGLLLPQVATEWGFDAARFLEETCRKAGLPPGAWRDPSVRVWRFQAEVFGEGESRAE